MKKSYLTFAASLIATAAFAQPTPPVPFKAHALSVLQPSVAAEQAKTQKQDFKLKPLDWANSPFAGLRKAPAKSYPAIQGELITEQPAGTVKNYYGSHNDLYYFWGYTFDVTSDGTVDEAVIADDGSVYIHNPISVILSDTWLKGTKTVGDTIEVTLPQPIYHQDESDGYQELTAYATKMNVSYLEDYGVYWPEADSISPNIKFVLRNDTLRMVNDGGNIALGLCDETGAWYGYADNDKNYYPVTDTPITIPSDVNSKAKTYTLTYVTSDADPENIEKDITLVKLAKDGNDIYLSDLYSTDDSIWLKGTLNGNKMTVKGNQYLGAFADYGYHLYGTAYGWKSVYDDYYEEYSDSVYLIDQIAFDYDADADTYTGENNYLAVNMGKLSGNTAAAYKQPVLAPWEDVAAKPAAPTGASHGDYMDYYGYNIFTFKLTNMSVDGKYLNPDKIYYNIYMDDDLFTFYPDEYEYIEEEMTDIPFAFTDSWDIYASGKTRQVSFYSTGYEKLAVQEYYLADDGTKYLSDLLVYDLTAEGIQDASISDNVKAETVSYTDISGRQVSKPQHGLYIKTVKYSDGSTKSQKVLVK